MARKSYKVQMESALWKLLDMAQELGVTVSFHDPATCEHIWPECHGYFDNGLNRVYIYKTKESRLSAHHIFTLAHELRHVHQYRNRMWPSYWLVALGVYPSHKDHPMSPVVEEDADNVAKEFMIKNRLPVPTDFSPEKI